MRILHLVENLNLGGAERVVISLVLQQVADGHDCRVVCLFESGDLANELRQAGVAVTPCNKNPGLDFKALWRLRKILRQTRPQVMHSHNVMPHYYGVLAALGAPMRRINTRHGMGDFLDNRRQRLLYRLSLVMTDYVCCVCNAARYQFVRSSVVPPDKAVTVFNGISINPVKEPKGCLRRELGLAPGARVIGTVGRLNPAKDHITLIMAFEDLAERDESLHLVLVGDGGERAKLTALATDSRYHERIHFLGARSDVPRLLPDFSLFVLSSLTEGFSVALIEAGAAGVPMLATNVGGNAEILADGRGRLVPPRDSVALADAARAMLDDHAGTAAMREAAQRWISRHCTVNAMAHRYYRVYEGEGC